MRVQDVIKTSDAVISVVDTARVKLAAQPAWAALSQRSPARSPPRPDRHGRFEEAPAGGVGAPSEPAPVPGDGTAHDREKRAIDG